MNVKELIDHLSNFDEDLPVYFAYDYGDYWGSVVANNVSEVDNETLIFSPYHNRMKRMDENEDPDESDEKTVDAVVLG
jgi:Fe-S-cluster formation regulator IscX/YfhJ